MLVILKMEIWDWLSCINVESLLSLASSSAAKKSTPLLEYLKMKRSPRGRPLSSVSTMKCARKLRQACMLMYPRACTPGCTVNPHPSTLSDKFPPDRLSLSDASPSLPLLSNKVYELDLVMCQWKKHWCLKLVFSVFQKTRRLDSSPATRTWNSECLTENPPYFFLLYIWSILNLLISFAFSSDHSGIFLTRREGPTERNYRR